MDALLVKDLRLMRKTTFENAAPAILETHRICKKVDLPGIPPDGLALQDAHMTMLIDGTVYDLVNKSLLVRIKSEAFYEAGMVERSLLAHQALGWAMFQPPENKEEPHVGSREE
jgi:hypothetical protein